MEALNTQNYVNNLSDEKAILLYGSIKESIDKNQHIIYNLSKWMLIAVFLYFLFSTDQLKTIQFAGATFDVNSYFEIIIPTLISLLILFYVVVSTQKADAIKTQSFLFNRIFGMSPDNDNTYERIFKQTLPVAVLNNIAQQNEMDKPKGCLFNIIIGMPIAILQALPHAFTIYGVNNIWEHHWNVPLGRFSLILCLFFLLMGMYLFIKYVYVNSVDLIKLKALAKLEQEG